MSSPSSNENLSAYFDRESSDEESRELESLLEDSAAARQELHEFGEISRVIQETATESAPPELAPSIRKRIEQETLLNSTAATPATAPAPSGPSMLRYRIAVAISTCSSLAALVLFVLLLNIPEPNAGTNW
ncbi:MAG: RseA family anti-sigma factor, partial [Gimesia chilikensis]